MNGDDYSSVPIVKNSWPEWVLLEGGGAERRWMFEFEDVVTDDASLEGLEVQDLQLHIRRGPSARELMVTAVTHANPWMDEVFFVAFYRLFQRMEGRFGRLRHIQGQSRDLWRPFRTGGP